ncbi:lysozyme C-1-like [Argiope bruennichi]|uniref:lysozyme C-1-like n=1 Tax=Argiope bruennichi TaxID=94029 RepID=UPI0024940609|nr:lysozyme C-1-like [Argiope bruennichi]
MISHLLLISFSLLMVQGKVYDRCELGRELYEKYHFPLTDIPRWLCVVHWESAFNTNAVNKGATPNSLDYGIFQINDDKWCKSPLRPSQNRCRISCERLKDDDLSDDVACLQQIIQEKGFHEWMSYGLRCNSNTEEYFKNCDFTSRALNVGMKLRDHPQPHVRFNIKHFKEQPNFMKIRFGLTSQPKGFKVNVNTKESRINFFTKFLSAHYKLKPFFSLHQYVTR